MVAGLMDGQAGVSQSNFNAVGLAVARRLGLLVGQTVLRAEVVGNFAKKRNDIIGALWKHDASAGSFCQLFHASAPGCGSAIRIEVGIQRDEIIRNSPGSDVA